MTIKSCCKHLRLFIFLGLVILTPLKYSYSQGNKITYETVDVKVGDRLTLYKFTFYDSRYYNEHYNNEIYSDSLIEFLNNHEDFLFEISSHTDSRGSIPFNLRLSSAQALNLCNYLFSKGIKRDRLSCVGYGESQLIYSDSIIQTGYSEEERERLHGHNRRVVVTVIKKLYEEDTWDTLVVRSKSAVLLSPNENKIAKMKEEYGEDSFYVAADDNTYYQNQARIDLVKKGMVVIETDKEKIKFILKDDKKFVINSDSLSGWGVIFFDGVQKPYIGNISDIEFSFEEFKKNGK